MTEPVDLTNLREMIEGDPEIEKELLSVFITSSEECLSSLQSSTNDSADEIWRAKAHAWKGMCLNLGADPLSVLCSKAQLHEGFTEDDKKALLKEIEDEYSKVKAFLNLA